MLDAADENQPPTPPLSQPDGGASDNAVMFEEATAVDGDELRLLSRSPHPYHRQSFELPHPSETFASRVPPGPSSRRGSTSALAAASSATTGRRPSSTLPASGPAPRRRDSPRPRPPAAPSSSSSSLLALLHPPFVIKAESSAPTSDSGTDADDEHFLKGLPAPKTRLHKGLRGRNEPLSGTSTPLLSPALLEEEGRRPAPSSHSLAGDGALKALEMSLRDRRAITERTRRKKEIIRRATELLILFSLGVILCSNRDVKPLVRFWSEELIALALLAAVLAVLYPVRVVYWAYTQEDCSPSKKLPLAIPSSFDPAPIFYPPAISLFVSLLLAPSNRGVILPNLVLSVATLPKQLIPFASSGELCSPVHWLLSTVPVAIPKWSTGALGMAEAVASREMAVLLYPLHQNLCMLLHGLTTTSLLPAELQLLSVALINILLLSTSPQMVILKALLWGGGLGILVFCGRVISWGVTLARVPKWRFRRVPLGSRRASLWRRISHVLPLRRVKHEVFGTGSAADYSDTESGSATDEDGGYHHHTHHIYDHKRHASNGGLLSIDSLHQRTLLGASTFFDGMSMELPGLSSKEDITPEIRFNLPSPTTGSSPENIASAPRRHTLPIAATRAKTHTPSGRRKRSASSSIRAFFSLTRAQASARKWMYAVWVYACILAITFGGVRAYVGEFALHGEEPIGWALGYLFGGIPWFRLQVVKANLERWVCLPSRNDDVYLDSSGSDGLLCRGRHGWVEHLRHASFGEANTRLVLSAYWLAIIVVGLAVVFKLTPIYEVDTRRKVFHFMMVGMFLPATFVDPAYVALALGIVLAAFLLLDLIRASQLPPLSKPIASFLTPYVDGRDLRGPVVISHIFLLIGCSIPLWLSLASLGRTGAGALQGWEVPTRDVSMVSGVICVGLGDAAASLIGRRWGHRKWVWGGGKSLEGSLAFAVAVFVGLIAAGFWLRVGGWPITGEGFRGDCCLNDGPGGDPGGMWHCAWSWMRNWGSWTRSVRGAAVCGAMASLTEAVLTGGNDNVVVPVVLWTCVKSLGV